MKLLQETFPHLHRAAFVQCDQKESFRELCDEYATCCEVVARLEQPGSDQTLRREYGALRLRLEGELLLYISTQSGPPSGPVS